MKKNTPHKSIQDFFELEPSLEQKTALNSCQKFMDEGVDDFLIIKGCAGTGKSTLIKAISNYLNSNDQKFFLAAPTIKAAKVIRNKTGYSSKTIHSLIFTPEPSANGMGVKMVRKINNSSAKSIFIIDEASMISDVLSSQETFISNKPLLTELLDYIKQGNPKNQVIFIGDTFQLAPIGAEKSYALCQNYLETKKNLNGQTVELNEVKRQDQDSYILKNATSLRNSMKKGERFSGIKCKVLPTSTAALKKFLELYEPEVFNKVTVLAWTNRDVNWFNNAIRDNLGLNHCPLSVGDQVQLQQNWVGDGRIILKGDNGIVRAIDQKIEKYASLNFITAEIEFIDGAGEIYKICTKVLLDILISTEGNISFEKKNLLFAETMKNNPVFRESRLPSDDQYLGSMQLRYGYATTCHKAQGSEWDNVILHPYMPQEDYRWQYTAITRASKELYTFAA